MKIKLDENAVMPERAHQWDAGLDLKSPYDIVVGAFSPANGNGKAIINTGVHVAIPEGYVGIIASKSGLNVKHDLTDTGVIDSGYTGSIVVKLYNHGTEEHHFKRGDKVAQLIIMPIIIPTLELVDTLEETERGNSGFGSSGA